MSGNGGATKWGVIGCGRISNDWAVGLSTLPPTEHVILATAARSVEAARVFAVDHGIPKVYNNYEDLVKDPEIDVVYIGTIHKEHFKLCTLALQHGKHVLCETPLAMNESETKGLIELARNKNCFLMEAVWSRFLPSYVKLKEEIEKGSIGEPLQIVSQFGYQFEAEDWRVHKNLGGGSTLEFGTYLFHLIAFIFPGLRPETIVASGRLNASGAEECASTLMTFPGGKMAATFTHNNVDNLGEATILGTKGFLKLPYPMWCATELETQNGTLKFELPKSDKRLNYPNGTGLSFESQEVRRCLQEGLIESPRIPWRDTIFVAEIRDIILKQVTDEGTQK